MKYLAGLWIKKAELLVEQNNCGIEEEILFYIDEYF